MQLLRALLTISSVPRVSFLEGSAGEDLLEAASSIPPTLVAKSPFYQLKLRGEAPSQSTWIMPIPNDSEPYETLDVYTWETAIAELAVAAAQHHPRG